MLHARDECGDVWQCLGRVIGTVCSRSGCRHTNARDVICERGVTVNEEQQELGGRGGGGGGCDGGGGAHGFTRLRVSDSACMRGGCCSALKSAIHRDPPRRRMEWMLGNKQHAAAWLG